MIVERFLSWCEAIGIRDVCGDSPRDFLQPKNCKKETGGLRSSLGQVKKENTDKSPEVMPEDILSEKVQEMVLNSHSLGELIENLPKVLKNFAPCQMAAHTLLGRGIKEAPKVMVISEKPCAEEDKKGELLWGPEGELLKRMLTGIGLSVEAQTYVGMLFPWRTPGDRKLTPLEKRIGGILIRRQITLIQPRILFLMGAVPAELISLSPLPQLREKWLTYKTEEEEIPGRVTFSLRTVLENPTLFRKKAWEDLCALKEYVER